MTWWWKSLFRKPELDSQMDAELRFHIDEVTRAKIAAGMSPEAARRSTVLEFGGREQIKEELRDVHRVRYLESAIANLKSAIRFIRKSPSFSTAVILTLALGIGANSAVFSAIDAILLRPLPLPESQQLMRVYQRNLKVKGTVPFAAPVRLEEWNRMNSTFQALTGYYVENSSETSGNLPEKLRQAFVAQRFLQVWGVAPQVGRDFTPEEQHFGGPGAVLISDRFWRNRFGASPDVLGKKIRIGNSFSLTIVGVMPPSFVFPERDIDLWSAVPSDAPYAQNRRSTWYTVIGRLKPGVTVAEARANLAAVQAQLGKAYPETDADLSVAIDPLKETTVASSRSSLWLLFGSVSLLLLIACTNIVTLLLARASQRQHEIAVRYSLGAPRAAIVGQLLTEVFVLAFLGAGLALFVAAGASSAFRSLAADLPRVEEIHLDWRIVLYAFGCALLATLLCGLVPAIRATRRPLTSSLAQASRTQVSGRNRLQWLLVGIQVALAVTLLAGAGLLLRSFQALGRVSPGFDASRVLTFRISGSYGETGDWKQLTQRIQQTVEALSALPGIESAATAGDLPGVPATYPTELNFLEGEQDQQRKIVAESRFISPSYLATLQIPLLSGELCRDPLLQDLPASSQGPAAGHRVDISRIEVLVNQSFVQTYSADLAAVGRHLRVLGNAFLAPDKSGEIRGIVGDAREEGMNHAPGPTVYWCMTTSGPDPFYLVRTRSAQPSAAVNMLRARIKEVEPSRSVFDIKPLADCIDEAFAENRMRTVLLAFFASTAIALACVGLYGTLSYSVNVRQREVGLRLALGALRGNIARQFLLQGLRVAAVGSAVGWLLAAGSGRLLAGMLYGVTPTDLTTIASVIVMVLLVAGAASLFPAVRAARLDPMHVLREE
jgi:putative ABC transport system permease protein